MNKIRFFAIISCLFIVSAISAQTQATRYRSGVLVEFFTSEGCSSCPEADVFSTEIKKIADSNGLMVYTLDWHVDLWDKSGWKDPFSDSAYTNRQLQLALQNKQKAMFTPMAFINGKGALPGAAKSEIGNLIQVALARPSDHFLLFSASWFPDQKNLVMEYDIKGKPDSCDVMFVLAEKEIFNYVKAGENQGKTLSHHNVVRMVDKNTRATEKGSSIFTFKTNEIDFSKYRVYGFLQHKRTMEVLAVQILEFKTEEKK